jgi:hypothetical protein
MMLVCSIWNIAFNWCVPGRTGHVACVYQVGQCILLLYFRWLRACGWSVPFRPLYDADVFHV